MKMLKVVILSIASLIIGFGMTGCGSQQQETAHNHAQESGANQSTAAPSNVQVEKAIQDELAGLSKIEAAVNKGDFESAGTTFEPLHDEYHAAVLPPIKEKNASLEEDMHAKFDALDSALDNKDKDKILNAIKTNKDSLLQASKELGISIK